MPTIDSARLRAAYEKVRDELLAERTPDGHWVGELSSSALSTATAISALAVVKAATGGRGPEVLDLGLGGPKEIDNLIPRGVVWLLQQQNPDGGFGDTDLSHSNIATTYLVVAALHLAGVANQHAELIGRANAYIDAKGRLQGLRDRYGIDKTFVVPIMTNLALAGLVDWREVDPLPFELACVPQSWYRFVGMPVVSYAIPALVAIGQSRHFHAPSRNPIARLIRHFSINRSLKVLRRMQPDSGGYLEATPLTSFVVMSLASIFSPHAPREVPSATPRISAAQEIIHSGVKFLINSARPDGSWPIDTNLATWNTTLAINALAGAGENVAALLGPRCLDWLLSCQHTKPHPFTGANPGGFGWSDLSGAVPDADDTAGALLAIGTALEAQQAMETTVDEAEATFAYKVAASRRREAGIRWLLGLQNADGGWPTFCRGWGKLPFDRSGADLTAHALLAISSDDPICYARQLGSEHAGPPSVTIDHERVTDRLRRYLIGNQAADGSWVPLWFGNQDHPREENPVYGTAKVVKAYGQLFMETPEGARGVDWLVANQNDDGGWGSGVWVKAQCRKQIAEQNSPPAPHSLISSIEETAIAVEALLSAYLLYPLYPGTEPRSLHPSVATAAIRGLTWLFERVENNQHRQPAPIGFYFAKLWYYERLYPLIFTVAALGLGSLHFSPPEAPPDIPADPASSDLP